MKPEAKFQKEVVRSLIIAGAHPVEIPDDSKKGYKFGNNVPASPKPYDVGVLDTEGLYQALELKHTPGLTWNYANLEDSERNGLTAVENRGRPAWVVICFRGRLGPLQKQRLGRDVTFMDEVWAIPHWWMDQQESSGEPSFDLADSHCWGAATYIPRLPGQQETLWDLTPLGLNLHEPNALLLKDL